ncbi:hypothetical protein CANTEDRAFT_116799 [Yamadazyma tenuis ATCC 10573]|uniref:BAH-domain-containing protein n=1 Tax=Candida tenuis (strain ATCC 10573 / BCRC 21748 / CBS 615 / JCM 9827 / NBRC 10315 / NRRL Y-1498 / VKM Y-70) TaxID=590646 RepID=G3BFT2_CANTC|nr:uncharacterized protein CANTEDRAFT_116799 [Yamadazyma tenuis ATCC 10573]EGV61242.1 hypothetical protein CANTEDRAFT_116799 [Yamadazyma tenuis ATCC 10573]
MSIERERKKLGNRLNHSIDGILELQDSTGFPVFETFQRLPLRSGTDYYKYIKNPISLHSVRQKVKKFGYTSGQEFIQDLTQITWNARLYNQRQSRVYTHAVILDNYLKDRIIPRLAQDKSVIDHESLHYPDLGPLPADDEPLVPLESATPDVKDEDYGDNQGDDDDYDEYQSMTPQPRRDIYQGMRPQYSSPYAQSSKHITGLETGIRRGRPPTVDKPYETRIKLILKNLKKLKNGPEVPLNIPFFDRLPDRNSYPEYYKVVSEPVSLFEIKGKLRTRKYNNVDEFLADLNLVFYNNKLFYGTHSAQIFQDLNMLEQEATNMIAQELQRSEQELMAFAAPGGDGIVRFPLDSLEVNGYIYRVGDWVLINNPNEPDKPTVGQIFRLWSLKDGTKYFNACWYYRAEQTCHRYDRLFYSNEVCKTGQYRDHIASEIIGPCYVVFLTRYQKGDLEKGVIPEGSPWFICEFRYNESNHVFNRIRTWRACLPDEIRDHPEPPVIPLREPRKLIKYESPIRALLPSGVDTNMSIPNVTEGAHPNAPPLVGSVYLREPDRDDDLGQYYTSPNVTASPENDDVVNNRKAYLFTPISQSKSVGYPATSSNAGYGSNVPGYGSAYTPLGLAQSPPQEFYDMNRYKPTPPAPKPYIAGPQRLRFEAPTRRQTTPSGSGQANNFHASTSSHSKVLPGGTVSYLIEDTESLAAVSDGITKRRRTDGSGVTEIVWYRSPPVLLAQRLVSQDASVVGHSARYLNWKASQV